MLDEECEKRSEKKKKKKEKGKKSEIELEENLRKTGMSFFHSV
jgi:hypothetical protein